MKRTPEISAAAILLVLAAIASIVLTLINLDSITPGAMPAGELPAGAPDMEQITSITRGVTIGMLALGLVVSSLAAFGLWRLFKWGYWLAVILGILKILSSAPIFFMRAIPVTPEVFGQMAVGLIVLIFLFLKDSREVMFPERR